MHIASGKVWIQNPNTCPHGFTNDLIEVYILYLPQLKVNYSIALRDLQYSEPPSLSFLPYFLPSLLLLLLLFHSLPLCCLKKK